MQKHFTTEIGPSPCDEHCAQVGSPGYAAQSRNECEAFKAQILRHYPVPTGVNAGVQITLSPHELGSYREVAVAYIDQAGADWAASVEADDKKVLLTWDEQSMEALGLKTA